MKKLLYLTILLVIIGCTRFGKDGVEIAEPLPPYMKELFTENKNCSTVTFLELNVGGKSYSKIDPTYEQYTDKSDPNSDRNYIAYRVEQDQFYNLFPSFIPINSSVIINSEEFTIKNVNPTLNITSNLPKGYLNYLKIGSYVLNNDPENKTVGFQTQIVVSCSLNETSSNSYCVTYNVDLRKPYQFKIECIDRSDPSNIKISGKFDGTFTPNLSADPNVNNAESKFITGAFSITYR